MVTGWLEFNKLNVKNKRCVLVYDCYIQNDLAMIGAAAVKAVVIPSPLVVLVILAITVRARMRGH